MFCHSKEEAAQTIETLNDWLAVRGLTLSEEKTRIVHLTEGFDFLGYNVRHYRDASRPTGYKLLITPSDEAVKRLKAKLRDEWTHLKGANHITAMERLNPLIRGWANYHRVNVAKSTFSSLEHWMYHKE